MARKIIIDNNYVVISHATSGVVLFECPLKDVKYSRSGDNIEIYTDTNNKVRDTETYTYDGFVDSGDIPIADVFIWLRANTGFNTASGSSGANFLLDDGSIPMTGAIDEFKGADIASATTTDIGAATGNYIDVTGVTTITGLGTIQAGVRRIVNFTGILTLTHNATSLILPTGANITTAVGDVGIFVSLGSGNWKCVSYIKADGTGLVAGGGEIQDYKHSGWVDAGALNTWIRIAHSNTNPLEFLSSTGVIDSLSMVTASDFIFYFALPFGVANGNQTAEELNIFVGNDTPTGLSKVSLIKVTYSDADVGTISGKTALYEGSTTIPSNGLLTIPSSSFLETAISDGDVVYLFYSATTAVNIAPVITRLKCSID